MALVIRLAAGSLRAARWVLLFTQLGVGAVERD